MSVKGFLKRWIGRDAVSSAPLPRPKLYADLYNNNNLTRSYGPNEMFTEFIGAEDGEPYVVRISENSNSGGGWIPLNVLIYAHNEHDAKNRILQGIKDVIDAHQRKASGANGHDTYVYDNAATRGYKLLELAAGKCREGHTAGIEAERFDKRCVVKASWAGNDNLV